MDVKTLCLGVLTHGEASGYEIKKQFEEGPMAHFYRAGFGSIYPALNQLDREELVTCKTYLQEKRPGKKVYQITEKGISAFRESLRQQPANDWIRSDCLFMLFFSEFLEAGKSKEVFDGYLNHYRQAVAAMSERNVCEGAPGGRKLVHDFGLTVYSAIVEFMENNRHLLDDNRQQESGTASRERAGVTL
jgi:DNA-binding PadR family transcriptional regulator